eukprot:SAG22_NODE_11110_length_500_cov_12.461347_1_plen_139_part_01
MPIHPAQKSAELKLQQDLLQTQDETQQGFDATQRHLEQLDAAQLQERKTTQQQIDQLDAAQLRQHKTHRQGFESTQQQIDELGASQLQQQTELAVGKILLDKQSQRQQQHETDVGTLMEAGRTQLADQNTHLANLSGHV